MSDLYKAKVRRVGSSLGILKPKELANKEKLKEGQEIEFGIIKEKKLSDINKAFGLAKGKLYNLKNIVDFAEWELVICVDVLEHIGEHDKAVREMKRVVRDGGLLLIHVPNKNQKHILFENPENIWSEKQAI